MSFGDLSMSTAIMTSVESMIFSTNIDTEGPMPGKAGNHDSQSQKDDKCECLPEGNCGDTE